MNIYVTPTIKKFKTEIYLSIDNNLIKFLNNIFKKPKLEFSNIIHNRPDLIIFTGGNNLINFSKNDYDRLRNSINQKTFKYGIKNKIKMIGICGGAQFIAKKFGSKISRVNGHIGHHKIYIKDKKKFFKKTYIVNSYHDFGITKISKKLFSIAIAGDNSIEFFNHKKKEILGIMWHPERYKKFKKIDKNIFKMNLWN